MSWRRFEGTLPTPDGPRVVPIYAETPKRAGVVGMLLVLLLNLRLAPPLGPSPLLAARVRHDKFST